MSLGKVVEGWWVSIFCIVRVNDWYGSGRCSCVMKVIYIVVDETN